MHELSVCQALIDQVEALAEARGASAVSRITVAIGALSGVEAHLLEQALPIASASPMAVTWNFAPSRSG
jgi:hydrogenase nickel incorporation protein HypA/HybF